MGGEEIIRVGAFTLADSDVGWAIGFGVVVAAFVLAPAARWHWREWRIRRALAQGDGDQAEYLMIERDEARSPGSIAGTVLLALLAPFGLLGLLIFQENFAGELEQMLGEGWGFAAGLLTIGFMTGLSYLVGRIRRNMMSPEQLAALEEEEEHRRWIEANGGDPAAAPAIGIAAAVIVLTAIVFFIVNGLPG